MRTVLRAGVRKAACGASSKPMTPTSAGTDRPA
jgi:hypothetical protein